MECGLCREVCAFCYDEVAVAHKPLVSYGAWSKEEGVRQVCASGGVGFEIGRSLIQQDYKVVAVKYNVAKQRAEHYVASTIEELIPSMGSKYIQSYTLPGFKAINRKQKYVVTGTPCQIDSFRRYIQKFRCEENFILMDFFCHGIPSKFVWDKYINEYKHELGEIDYVAWRNKLNGWHDSWAMVIDSKKEHGEIIDWHDSYNMLIREKKGYVNSRCTQGDTFYSMFLGNNCLGKACYKNCKYKFDHSSADIRIGDMWGNTYKENEKGVTACVVFSEKGKKILEASNCHLEEFPFNQVAEGQIKAPISYPKIGWKIIISCSKNALVSMKLLAFVNQVIGKLNRIINRID